MKLAIILALTLTGCATAPRYAAGDPRCTPEYQRATAFEFWGDDRPGCPGLRGVAR